MYQYSPHAYNVMHQGIRVVTANLKDAAGQKKLHQFLASTDVVIVSFRPAALKKLGIDWPTLRQRYPHLSMISIVGASGARANEPGHDLTYQAEHDLLTGLELPATLYADMGGALLTSEAILQARLQQLQNNHGVHLEVALNDAAGFLALPRAWGLTQGGTTLSGLHAGYQIYPCQDGRVALAALEPHFIAALGRAIGLENASLQTIVLPETRNAIARFMASRSCAELDALSAQHDIPLHTLEPTTSVN